MRESTSGYARSGGAGGNAASTTLAHLTADWCAVDPLAFEAVRDLMRTPVVIFSVADGTARCGVIARVMDDTSPQPPRAEVA